MEHITGIPREQLTIFPEAIEDYIAEDNPVRFIDAFVHSLDLSTFGFQKADVADTGRPPYHPSDLLKLYIYGYLNRVRSSRRLERETQRNLEVMWLLKKLTPDHKTISDFRKDNGQAIRAVCCQFVLLCQRLDLFGAELVAIDGSKFSASNANRRNFTKAKLQVLIQKIDATVSGYLETLETADREEAPPLHYDAQALREKIASLKERSAEYHKLLNSLKEQGETQVSLTDPDSRMMSDGGKRDVAYNVQLAVDNKHKLIVEHEVTNEPNDRTLLAPIAKKAKEVLAVDHLEVCADKGYWSGTAVRECEEHKIVTYIPEHGSTGTRKSNIPTPEYAHTQFHYDKERDMFICPQNQELARYTRTWVHGRWRYEYRTPACLRCPAKLLCTADKGGRRMYRSGVEDMLQRLRDRVARYPDKVKQRQMLSEHPFGTLKHGWNQRYFLLRGLHKVRTEMSLSVLAYNMRRAMNILSVAMLMRSVCTTA
ncbi:MAG: IS1182 family transposase [Ignavibacteriales bacterium]|nr:IS1182 family transposase [Ignavibacteriales bacterium]